MAIIDYHSIKSLIFARLSPSSRILIPVLSCLCDDWDGSISPEHSKHHVLAMYSGLANSSVKLALKELQEKSIISIETQRGRPASIQYIPQLKLSAKYSKGSRSSATLPRKVADNQLPLQDGIPPQTPADTGQNKNGNILALNDSPKIKEQQPAFLELSDRIGHTLVKRMIGKHGSNFVVVVLKAMEGRNGSIDDPAAYFVSCCDKGIIPKTREQKAKARATEKRLAIWRQEEEERLRWEEEKKKVLQEQDDPAVQERISKAQQDFWTMTSGQVRPHRPPP